MTSIALFAMSLSYVLVIFFNDNIDLFFKSTTYLTPSSSTPLILSYMSICLSGNNLLNSSLLRSYASPIVLILASLNVFLILPPNPLNFPTLISRMQLGNMHCSMMVYLLGLCTADANLDSILLNDMPALHLYLV